MYLYFTYIDYLLKHTHYVMMTQLGKFHRQHGSQHNYRTVYLHVVLAGVIEYAGMGNSQEYVVERKHDVVDEGETDEQK